MTEAPDDVIRAIARNLLGVAILDARQSDSLDFHSLSVSTLRKALEAAWKAGRESASEPPP